MVSLRDVEFLADCEEVDVGELILCAGEQGYEIDYEETESPL